MKSSLLLRLTVCIVLIQCLSSCGYNVTTSFPVSTKVSDSQCLRSSDYTLHRNEGGYYCLPAVSRCEKGFVQGSDKPSLCEAKTGCKYIPGDCFCQPDINVMCVCGGGEPPMCV